MCRFLCLEKCLTPRARRQKSNPAIFNAAYGSQFAGADRTELLKQARACIGKWPAKYNTRRPHAMHGILTRAEVRASKTRPPRMAV
jgi:hypothetical protein